MPVFADSATISISLEAAGTLGTTIGVGLAGAVKILVGFFRTRERELIAELKANRAERAANLDVQRKSARASRGLRKAIAELTARLERIEEHAGVTPKDK